MVMAVVGGIIMLVALYLILMHGTDFGTVVGATGNQVRALVVALQGRPS